MKYSIEQLRQVKGIGEKTIQRIEEQFTKREYTSKYDSELHIYPNTLVKGDMLEEMNGIPDKSVDLILTDLPYGTTTCSWDEVISLDKMWSQYKRVIKDNGAIVLFGSEPFSSRLRLSNVSWYRYDIVWEKEKPTNFFQLKRRVGKHTEYIHVFYNQQPTYNPQMRKHEGKRVTNKTEAVHNSEVAGVGGKITEYNDTGFRYPKDVIQFNRVPLREYVHPTQKPLDLLAYLIRTFTNKGDLVLDSTMGSGSTCVAAKASGRSYIGIEKDEEYYNIAVDRVNREGDIE